MQQATAPNSASIRTGTQVAAVLVVLLAIFALPCCPRVDGFFEVAQARAAAAETATATDDHSHHPGHQHHHGDPATDDTAASPHKGHVMTSGSIDVLPSLSPIALAALIPLARIGVSRVAHLSYARVPRIPVPPPRPIS